MNAEVLSIGNEVLSGRTLDTNFQHLARLLEGTGARIVGHQAVSDREDAIAAALSLARSRADLIVCTGGLGPTPDDLTVRAVAAALGLPLVRDDAILEALRERWRAWARGPMPANNEQQALLPWGATAWPNPIGSAPGVHVAHEGKDVVLLPGVPEEMSALAQQFLVPLVRAKSGITVEYALIRTVGIAESVLEERLADLEQKLDGAWVAYLPGLGGVDVRVSLPAEATPERRGELAQRARAIVRERAGDYVFTDDDRSLEQFVGDLLREKSLAIAVAESCTGGLLGGRITAVPGSSAYFAGGVICYSNASKMELVDVPATTLGEHGAVSEETARALARGVARRFDAACGVGVTGIAGPDGGTPEKPVGTVHVAVVGPDGEHHRHLRLRGNRAQVRERSVTAALDLVRRLLTGLPATSPGAMGTPPAEPRPPATP
ncbi:MAG: competence/damage-inducible protein A [Candidatus Eiseniibacteriota bacterium]